MQTATASSAIPMVKSLPYLGVALDMRIDPLRYFLRLYQTHGSVFQVTLLGRPIAIMAGMEANRFLARSGDEHFGSELLFGGLARELGSDALLTALDGVPHRHQRKIQRRGFSRETIQSQLGVVTGITHEFVSRWTPGEELPIFPTVQRIVTDQLGILLFGRTVGDLFGAFWTLFNTSAKVHLLKTHPKFYLKLPGFLRAKRDIEVFSRDILAWHRANPPVDREPRLLDDLIAAVDENGEPYSEEVLLAGITGSYFAGMDTVASTISFMLYAALKVPGLKDRLLAEVDAVFDNPEGLTPSALRNMDVLHNTALETLRLYPVTPFTPRVVVKAFDFEGYHFPVGTEVYIANTLTHLLPDYFPNPEVFDVDRHTRDTKVPQSFAPFTLGAHSCLGAGMAEVQMMTVIAALLRTADLTLASDEDVTVYANPLPNPGRKFAFKYLGARKAL